MNARPIEDWDGPFRSYDLVKEIVAVFVGVLMLTVLLAALFRAPQRDAVTFEEWAGNDPAGFMSTTLDELSGQSGTATYGPPYNDTPDAAQSLLGVAPAQVAGVRVPIDTVEHFVLEPLDRLARDGALVSAINEFRSASPGRQAAWTDAYATALGSATVDGRTVTVASGDYGPVEPMMRTMLSLAQSGGVDAALIDSRQSGPGFFVLDYTRSQLYLADGDYFAGLGRSAGLAGDQWGMAATLGNWPGQVWLLPVSFWYQIPPASTSANGDLIVLTIVGVLGLVLALLPYIPGLRSIPRRLGIYRLIWRRHYRATGE